ncbi:MAG: hypothetical protein ABR608_03520 [Pseudonocardiaceae bacterium]
MLTAQPGAAEYGPGQPRELRMVVANVGLVPCRRDLDPALQEMVVLAADGARLWSSNDCYGRGGFSERVLQPGEQLVSSVVWGGRTSQPGCPAQREAVPAGDYQLVAKLGQLTSPPAAFRLLG